MFTDFNSGDSFEPAWAPHYVSDDIFDNDGKPIAWRYTNNAKGSVNEEFCCLYAKEILYPALGYLKHRETHPGYQGVIICDDVGIHIGYSIVNAVVGLGLEILLRAPHLNFAL